MSNYYNLNKPKFALCLGGYAFSVNFKGKEDPYAQFEAQRGFYYNAHNVAMTYTSANLPDVRSKEIFVPFQERIPYLEHFPMMKYLADVVGANTRVSLYESGNEVHKTLKGHKFMPILCYESIFPLFLSEKGEEIDFYVILANEYWNKNIKGSEQYLYNNVAVAIQSRIPICRSSNGGISAIIDKDGNIIATKKGNDLGLLNAKIEKKTEETFYESIRGVFSKIAIIGFFTIIIIGLFQKLFLKKSNS
jgi:apolipoprotein N-acyltransferase